MKITYFLFPETGWVGVAFGRDWSDVFWAIDEHGDPYSVLLIHITASMRGSFCVLDDYDEDTGMYGSGRDHETNEYTPFLDDPRWSAPQWDKKLPSA